MKPYDQWTINTFLHYAFFLFSEVIITRWEFIKFYWIVVFPRSLNADTKQNWIQDIPFILGIHDSVISFHFLFHKNKLNYWASLDYHSGTAVIYFTRWWLKTFQFSINDWHLPTFSTIQTKQGKSTHAISIVKILTRLDSIASVGWFSISCVMMRMEKKNQTSLRDNISDRKWWMAAGPLQFSWANGKFLVFRNS